MNSTMNEQSTAARVPVGQTETVAEAVNRFSAAGYTDSFVAESGGLRAVNARCVHTPETLVVEGVFRFEGITDPSDEAIVFALRCKLHGTKGTYVTSYGPAMSPADAEMVRRLNAASK